MDSQDGSKYDNYKQFFLKNNYSNIGSQKKFAIILKHNYNARLEQLKLNIICHCCGH